LYDVAVIGGGPVGSRVACRLAEDGYTVTVLEKKSDLGEPVCCTGIISRECVQRYDIDESVIFRRVNGATIHSPGSKLLSIRRHEPQAAIIDRAAFNVSMAKRAQDRGVEYMLDSPVSDVAVQDDRVGINVKNTYYEAKAVVIASGFGSKLVEEAGLGRVDDFAVGAQAEVDTNGVDEVEVYLGKKVAPAFFAWLVPISPKRALAGLISRSRQGFYLRSFISSLAAQGKVSTPEPEISYAGIPLRGLSRTSGNRVMVVGSAAGQVKPTTGGGIYYGLLCADIAADNLHRALESDNLSARSLASYDRQWKKVLGREQRLGYWGRKFYELLSDRQIDRILDIIVNNNIDDALLQSDEVTFDWHSKAILKLIGHRALSRTIRAVRLPFPTGRKD
jgi:digeranylgeranylglycerophospholipid reductase